MYINPCKSELNLFLTESRKVWMIAYMRMNDGC